MSFRRPAPSGDVTARVAAIDGTAFRATAIRGAAVVFAMTLLLTASAPATLGAELVVPTTPGQSVTVSWTGTVLPGVNADSECGAVTDVGADQHTETISVPAGAYDAVTVTATASITFSGSNDLIVTIIGADGSTASGDSGSFGAGESASIVNPAAGTLRIISCAFAGVTPQMYTGTLTLTATEGPPPAGVSCKAPGKALQFSTPAYVDTHRAGGEPSVQALSNGTLLYASHAGTTHFYAPEATDPDSEAFAEKYRGQVHAYVSNDNGTSWQFVDRTLPPNVPFSGFSDPDFAVDDAGNVYLSEINLANVSMSKSMDSGRSYALRNLLAMTITDRQWSSAGPRDVLYLVGNASEGGSVPSDPAGNSGHLIYRSTDGGATYSEAIHDDGGLGDLVWADADATLYEPHYDGGALQVAAFRNPLAADAATALTPELNTVASGASLASHWPAIDVDVDGNVYVVWDETGGGERQAGVWYSFSTDGARTWATPTRVDSNDHTDLWPWIAVGAPGRVAIAWMENDHKLPGNDPEQASFNDPWNVFVAQSLTGLGCGGTAAPAFRIARATPQPFHTGTVCTGGTICQAQLVDRRLGDYFTIDIDWSGRLVAAYSDTRKGGSVALPSFFRQTGGTLFNRGKLTGTDR
jgi:hypothetical protein